MRHDVSPDFSRAPRERTADPDLVERVAAAMWESREGAEPRTWDTADDWRDIYLRMAVVAIDAVRRFDDERTSDRLP